MSVTLPTGRVRSIDAFRGLTFVVMVFVNALHGVSGMPAWARHMPADADAMSFVDVVFPAFLFIVGLSLPFALNERLRRGEPVLGHTLARALALVVMGYFMVNAESGFDERAMPIPIAAWALLSYLGFALVWGVYRFERAAVNDALRAAGIVLLLALAATYRGGPDGRHTMTPQWWGILGLIGWAYLAASVAYRLTRGRLALLLAALAACVAYYVLSHLDAGADNPVQRWLLSHDGHAAHTSIVLAGTICALLFFDTARPIGVARRFAEAGAFALALVIAGALLRPAYRISKIYATPTWCLYSAAICIALFALLFALVDVKRVVRWTHWTHWVEPAAASPLATYLMPFVIEALLALAGWELPAVLRAGVPGALWAAAYAAIVVAIVAAMNRANLRLRV